MTHMSHSHMSHGEDKPSPTDALAHTVDTYNVSHELVDGNFDEHTGVDTMMQDQHVGTGLCVAWQMFGIEDDSDDL